MLQAFDNNSYISKAIISAMMFSFANVGYNEGVVLKSLDFCYSNYTFGYYSEVNLEKQNYYNSFGFSTCVNSSYNGISANNSVLDGRKDTIEVVKSFGQLLFGWDGYNGQPVDKDVIGFAMELITILPKQIEAFPLSSGNIQLQCENEKQDYLELELLPNRDVELFIEWSNGEIFEKSICYNDLSGKIELSDLVNRFQGDFVG